MLNVVYLLSKKERSIKLIIYDNFKFSLKRMISSLKNFQILKIMHLFLSQKDWNKDQRGLTRVNNWVHIGKDRDIHFVSKVVDQSFQLIR